MCESPEFKFRHLLEVTENFRVGLKKTDTAPKMVYKKRNSTNSVPYRRQPLKIVFGQHWLVHNFFFSPFRIYLKATSFPRIPSPPSLLFVRRSLWVSSIMLPLCAGRCHASCWWIIRYCFLLASGVMAAGGGGVVLGVDPAASQRRCQLYAREQTPH